MTAFLANEQGIVRKEIKTVCEEMATNIRNTRLVFDPQTENCSIIPQDGEIHFSLLDFNGRIDLIRPDSTDAEGKYDRQTFW